MGLARLRTPPGTYRKICSQGVSCWQNSVPCGCRTEVPISMLSDGDCSQLLDITIIPCHLVSSKFTVVLGVLLTPWASDFPFFEQLEKFSKEILRVWIPLDNPPAVLSNVIYSEYSPCTVLGLIQDVNIRGVGNLGTILEICLPH